MSKRKKYAHLFPGNVKVRNDFIESHQYIDGVVNDKGEKVIRELTTEEKEWLNNFNKETINARLSPINKSLYRKDRDRKAIRHENYARNNDTLGIKKVSKLLEQLNESAIEKIDDLQTQRIDNDLQNLLNNDILDLKMQLEEIGFFKLKKADKDYEEKKLRILNDLSVTTNSESVKDLIETIKNEF